jgi:hypothetical protein
MNVQVGTLMRLSGSGQMLAEPHQDVRGHKVVDCDCYEVGDLPIDPERHKVRLLIVRHGGLLRDAAAPLVIPVEFVERTTDGEVGVDRSRVQVARAPVYDPARVDHGEQMAKLYGHYGYTPYGTHGYLSPARVFFMSK